MADIKINDLTAYTNPVSTDVLPIVDIGNDLTKKIQISNLLKNATGGSATAPSFAFDADPDTGMYRYGTNAMAFTTAGNGRLFINSSGNVGIGTTSPASILHVEIPNGAAYIRSRSTLNSVQGFFGASNGGVDIGSESNNIFRFYTNNAERLRIDSSGNVGIGTSSPTQPLDVVGWVKTTNGLLGVTGRVSTASGGINISTGATANPIIFTGGTGSANAERMRITSEGYVYFNTTASPSSSGYGSAFIQIGSSGSRRTALYQRSETTSASSVQAFYNPNGQVGSISMSGSATAYNTSSDYRLKENVVPLTGAVDRVNQLQVHRFNFLADPDKTVDGFIAHEAQAVVPECATGTKDEVDDEGNPVYQGIDQSKLVPLLTAALQEAMAKIETLEQRLSDAGIA